MAALSGIKVLLVIGGGIAAYKSCELIRLIRKNGGSVTCVLTEGGARGVRNLKPSRRQADNSTPSDL